MQQQKSKTPWIVCGVIALVVVCGGAAVIGIFALLAARGGGAEGLAVEVALPYNTQVGEEFELPLTLRNEGDKAFTVDTITLPAEMLALAQVRSVEPAGEDQGSGKYKVAIAVAPGESQFVTFSLDAVAEGTITGEVTVASGKTAVKVDVASIGAKVNAAQPTEAPAPTSIPTDAPASTGEIAGIPYKAVVQILAMVDMEGEITPGWSGSGSIVSPDGLILTNAHVVLSDRYYEVQYLVVAMTTATDAQPEAMYIAEIMQVDQALDIAVIRIAADLGGDPIDRASLNLPTVPFGNDGALQLGDDLTILGYPTIGGSTITLTNGKVSGFTAEEGYGNRAFIKTSATISGGNSGGLAANAQGQIIGIPTQLGYGGDDQYVDCRVLADTNRDGVVDENDSCVPTGGFINALRPLSLARPLIDAAARGEVNIKMRAQEQRGSIPEEESSKVLFADDFSDADSGWANEEWEDGAALYAGGEYQVEVKNENWTVWSTLDADYDDTILSVDTRVMQATGVGDFGLICRYVDENNFYGIEVSEDGYFAIWKQLDGEYLALYDWEASDAIPEDGAMTINAACVGNRLLIGVNDVVLADITDDSFSTGKAGIVAGTLDQSGFQVAFDNFVILEPK